MRYEITIEESGGGWLANAFEVTEDGDSSDSLAYASGDTITGIVQLVGEALDARDTASVLESDLRELLSRDDEGEFDRVVAAVRSVDSGGPATRNHAVQVVTALAAWDGEPNPGALYEYIWGA